MWLKRCSNIFVKLKTDFLMRMKQFGWREKNSICQLQCFHSRCSLFLLFFVFDFTYHYHDWLMHWHKVGNHIYTILYFHLDLFYVCHASTFHPFDCDGNAVLHEVANIATRKCSWCERIETWAIYFSNERKRSRPLPDRWQSRARRFSRGMFYTNCNLHSIVSDANVSLPKCDIHRCCVRLVDEVHVRRRTRSSQRQKDLWWRLLFWNFWNL